MREIKFRGKCIRTNEWLYGSLIVKRGDFYIGYESEDSGLYSVTPIKRDTAGQYTGLKGKNGREIYEGDILRVWQEDEYIPNRDSGGGIIDYDCEGGFSQIGKVGFTGCSFDYSTIKTLAGRHEKIHAPIDWIDNYEVIGNIYENPELLGDKK